MTVSNVKSYSYDPVVAGKNFVINGGLDFWQRQANPDTPLYITSGNGYNADRWTTHQFQDALHSRSAITPGSGPTSRFALRVGSLAVNPYSSGSRMVAASMIESNNSFFLRNQTVTLSFWIRFSSATFASVTNTTNSSYGNFTFMLAYFTSTTDAPIGTTAADSQSFTTLTNGSFPTVWTKYTLTATAPSNVNNIMVRFGVDALGSTTVAGTNWYEIADVQVEQNSIATQFSRAGGNYVGELELCQRYYYRISKSGGSAAIGPVFFNGNANAGYGIANLPVSMRIPPSSVEFANLTMLQPGVTTFAVTNITLASERTENVVTFGTTSSGGMANGNPYVLFASNNGFIAFSAEI